MKKRRTTQRKRKNVKIKRKSRKTSNLNMNAKTSKEQKEEKLVLCKGKKDNNEETPRGKHNMKHDRGETNNIVRVFS